MTNLGKIFTVIIFILSVAFMMLAVTVYMTHVNWKMLADNPTATAEYDLGYKQRLAQAQEENQRLLDEIERLKTRTAQEMAARRHALAALRTKMAQAEAQLAQTGQQLTQLQTAHSTAAETLRTNTNTLESYTNENATLRTDMKTVFDDRNDKFDKVVALTDKLNAAQGEFRNLQERNVQLVGEVADRRRVMDKVGLSRNHDVEAIAPKVDGIVTAVNDGSLIEVSIGYDDGLRKGHKLDVYNGNSYKGRVVVRKTYPDRAVAEIMKDYRQGIIKRNDSVATRLTADRTIARTN